MSQQSTPGGIPGGWVGEEDSSDAMEAIELDPSPTRPKISTAPPKVRNTPFDAFGDSPWAQRRVSGAFGWKMRGDGGVDYNSRFGKRLRGGGPGKREMGDGVHQIFGDRIRRLKELQTQHLRQNNGQSQGQQNNGQSQGQQNKGQSQGQQNNNQSQDQQNNNQSQGQQNHPNQQSSDAVSTSPISPKTRDPRTITTTSSFLTNAEQRIESFINDTHTTPNSLLPPSAQEIETNLAWLALASVHLRWKHVQLSTADPPQPEKQQEITTSIDRLKTQLQKYIELGKSQRDFSAPLIVNPRDEDCEKLCAELQAHTYRIEGPDTYLKQQGMQNLMAMIYERSFGVCRHFLVSPDWLLHEEQIRNKQSVAFAVQFGLQRFEVMAARRLWTIVAGYLGSRFLPGLDLQLGGRVQREGATRWILLNPTMSSRAHHLSFLRGAYIQSHLNTFFW